METTTKQTILTRDDIEDALAAKVKELYPELAEVSDFVSVEWVVRLRDFPVQRFRGDEVAFIQATVSQEALLPQDLSAEFSEVLQ